MNSVLPLLVLLALVSACDSSMDADVRSDDVVRHEVVREESQVPARYRGGVPTSVAGFEEWRTGENVWMPMSHVRDAVLAGDERVFSILEVASRQVPQSESDAWSKAWFQLLRHEEVSPEFCGLARKIMEGDDSTMRRAVSGTFSSSCARSGDLDLVEASATPAWAVLAFREGERERGASHPVSDRLARAVREVVLNGEAHEARSAAFLLVELDDSPGAVQVLRDVHREIKDQRHADHVAMAFLRSNDRDARKIGIAACGRHPQDAMCTGMPATPPASEEEGVDKPDAEAVNTVLAKLRSLGFERVATLDPDSIEGVAPELILIQAGHAFWFDVETGMYPNEHDSLMRSLARLVSPALSGAVFEEIPPATESDEATYDIRVYIDGLRYRVQARNNGDWYDVEAVLRLMNHVLSDKGSDQRLAVLASSDQTAVVVGARKEALAAAFKDGVLESGDPDLSEALGKDFENRIMKSLEQK